MQFNAQLLWFLTQNESLFLKGEIVFTFFKFDFIRFTIL